MVGLVVAGAAVWTVGTGSEQLISTGFLPRPSSSAARGTPECRLHDLRAPGGPSRPGWGPGVKKERRYQEMAFFIFF